MYEYSEECILTFLKNQGQLFAEPVAETEEEAEAFLEDCMAAVVDSLEEVRDYLKKTEWMWMACPWKNWKMPAKCLLCREDNISLWRDKDGKRRKQKLPFLGQTFKSV